MNALYERMAAQLRGLLEDERDFIANCANTSALLMLELERINWVGFYFLRDGELVLGPFQGRPACARIGWGEGVCGASAKRRESLVVPDVHAFPGHIVCDTASRSEVVVPLIWQDQLLGVLDVDSPDPGRFDENDRIGLEAIAGILISASTVPASL